MIGQQVEHSATATATATAAERNFAANLQALKDRQPSLAAEVAELPPPDVDWLFARDGVLTARTPDGAWWSGSSLPRRTAQAILEKMELGAVVTCFLSPTHAQQVRVTLDRQKPTQALIAALPNVTDLRLMLGCESFATEIETGRLWFASGENWDELLERILTQHEGLPVPAQFVRTALIGEERSQAMIARAQGVLSREIGRRAERMTSIFTTADPASSDRVCVLAPAAFRLWDDAGHVIGDLAKAAGWQIVNSDDPCAASPLAFASVAATCGTVVSANLGRAELSESLPRSTRVITWITTPRFPRFDPRAAGDRLIVADERWRPQTLAAGWPIDHVAVGGWPARASQPCGRGLGVIADTLPIVRPDFTLSSHNVLWDTIAQELAANPFEVGQDVAAYLARWLRRGSIADDTVDQRIFVDRLIVPAYQQGLVRFLLRAGIPLHLHGCGWETIHEFAPSHRGPIADRDALRTAIDACAALVHAWPITSAHPIDSVGLPVLRRTFRGVEAWLHEARQLARGTHNGSASTAPELTTSLVMGLIRDNRPAHMAGAE
jgi:hypothetical protein